jgi:hypothetical protein
MLYLHGVGAANAEDASEATNCGRALLIRASKDPVERAKR